MPSSVYAPILRLTVAVVLVLAGSSPAKADLMHVGMVKVRVQYGDGRADFVYEDDFRQDHVVSVDRPFDLSLPGGQAKGGLTTKADDVKWELGVRAHFQPVELFAGLNDSIWTEALYEQWAGAGVLDSVSILGDGAGHLQYHFTIHGATKYGWTTLGGAAELEAATTSLEFLMGREGGGGLESLAKWELQTAGLPGRGQAATDTKTADRSMTIGLPYVGGKSFDVAFWLFAENRATLFNIDGGEFRGAMDTDALQTVTLQGVTVLDSQGRIVPSPMIQSANGYRYPLLSAAPVPVPVPEPALLWLVAGGVGAVVGRARRRRRE